MVGLAMLVVPVKLVVPDRVVVPDRLVVADILAVPDIAVVPLKEASTSGYVGEEVIVPDPPNEIVTPLTVM
jgi:hypothetical protein